MRITASSFVIVVFVAAAAAAAVAAATIYIVVVVDCGRRFVCIGFFTLERAPNPEHSMYRTLFSDRHFIAAQHSTVQLNDREDDKAMMSQHIFSIDTKLSQ